MLDTYLKECLYFTANRLSRIATKMAEDEFAVTRLSPSYAYLMMAVDENEGISQKELCKILHLTPSTVTRLIEKLIGKDLIYHQVEGRMSRIYTTDKGKTLMPVIHECWDRLRNRYNTILGDKEGDRLAMHLDKINEQLEGK